MTREKEKDETKVPSLFIMLLEESLSQILARGRREVRGGNIQNGFAANRALGVHMECRTRTSDQNACGKLGIGVKLQAIFNNVSVF